MTRWVCEDEEEALGLELVYERAGVDVRIVEREGAFVVEAEGERAEQIAAGIARHYVRADDRERAKKIASRERWRARAFKASLAIGALGLMLAAWR
ncbi:MAG TPA: hypothetical protein VG755_00020 [Nannocystaceae bacterium]|nr:hypothetical protein [Nannocystaceae bacterium]